jgi:Ca2+-binding EF-hand superfamily protein
MLQEAELRITTDAIVTATDALNPILMKAQTADFRPTLKGKKRLSYLDQMDAAGQLLDSEHLANQGQPGAEAEPTSPKSPKAGLPEAGEAEEISAEGAKPESSKSLRLARLSQVRRRAAKAKSALQKDVLQPADSLLQLGEEEFGSPSAELLEQLEEDDLSEDQYLEPRRTSSSLVFDLCMQLSKEHNAPLHEVRSAHDEFLKLDLDMSGQLSMMEFEAVMRQRLGLTPGAYVPKHLLLDLDGCKVVSFKEFFDWQRKAQWNEELLVPDEKERELRRFAQENGIHLQDLDRLKKTFDSFDEDGSGTIDKPEFKQVLCKVLRLKDPMDVSQQLFQRYWREADVDNSGSIDFGEFALWYNNIFPM